jgi:hypothetical protein
VMSINSASSLEVDELACGRTTRRWPHALCLFLGFFLLYAATSPGDVIGDTEMRWAIATRLVDTGWFALPAHSDSRLVEGREGKWYFFTGPAQPILLAPFVSAGRWLAALPLPIHASGQLYGQFLASLLLFPAFGAVAVMMVYLIASEVSDDRRAAIGAAVILGLCTMHWHNSVNSYEESQTGVCALVTLWAVLRSWKRGGWRYPLLACAASGIGLAFRVSSISLAGPLLLCGICFDAVREGHWTGRFKRLGVWLAAGIVGLGPWIGLLAAFNYARFGSPFETGYGIATARLVGRGLFDTPFLEGFGGLLVSPGKSVFLFNPILLLAIPGLVILWRRSRPLAITVLAAFAGVVLFHARYTFWSGDLAWGPRYLASGMGIFVLALTPLMWAGRRRLLTAFVAASVAVQLASVVYGFGLEFFQDRRHGTIPDAYVWRPAESQLFCRFRNIALDLTGRPDYGSTPPVHERPATYQVTTSQEEVKRQHALAFFPFKAYATTHNVKLFRILLGLWLTILAALAATVWRWKPWRELRRPEPAPSASSSARLIA